MGEDRQGCEYGCYDCAGDWVRRKGVDGKSGFWDTVGGISYGGREAVGVRTAVDHAVVDFAVCHCAGSLQR